MDQRLIHIYSYHIFMYVIMTKISFKLNRFRKLSRVCLGSSDAVAVVWAFGRLPEVISDVFFLFHSPHGRYKKW